MTRVLSAAMGIFKPSKHHHHRHLHLRKKHREKKHHHDDSQGSSVVSELTDASEFTQVQPVLTMARQYDVP